jgi:hypothetical protein
MVEEPMKTLHVQRSWRFSVFSRRKLLHQIPRPDRLFDRMIDFAIARRIVNAANKNKRILVGRRCFERMNSSRAPRARKERFSSSFHIAEQRRIRNPYPPVLELWIPGSSLRSAPE